MRELLKKLFHDQNGMILSSEVVMVGTILVLGSIVGLAAVSHAVTHELNDVAQACDQSYNNPYGDDYDDYSITSSEGQPEIQGAW